MLLFQLLLSPHPLMLEENLFTPQSTKNRQVQFSMQPVFMAGAIYNGKYSVKWYMKEIKTKFGDGGRIVIPVEYRKALGIKPGDEVILSLEEDGLRILTPQQAVKRAQALVRQYVPETRYLSEELIQERREEG